METPKKTGVQTFVFKTSINCDGCVATVTPFLNEMVGVLDWQIDITNNNKILTVSAENIDENYVIKTVQGAGFNIEAIEA